MLKQDKIEFIWNYGKTANHTDMDYESLNNESDEFLDIVLEDIFDYENWDINKIENYKSW